MNEEMDITAAIIDQRLSAISSEIKERALAELNISDPDKLKSLAFVYLTVKTILDLTDDEAFDCLTEGGGDFGVDAVHISEQLDGEFTATIFQGKYKKSLDGKANFPESGIKSLINAIRYLFDPRSNVTNINDRLKIKVEEVRSLIRDGYIPQIRAVACNNGLKWNEATEEEIQRARFGDQVFWEHVNHERLVKILQASKPVNDTLQLSGSAIVEDFNFSRVLVGRIAVTQIKELLARHSERLLERNIRRYLGLQGNRVNEAIRETLIGENEKKNFYFYNNGITLICDKFSYNALQSGDYKVKVDNLQIINGGQTCMTILKTLQGMSHENTENEAFVLVRLYQLPDDNDDFVRRITYATNSQNPVDLRDLRANDEKQQRLETDLTNFGYTYRRKRTDSSTKPTDITSGVAAEAILSTWLEKPHQAKFFTREHFGKLYDTIFYDNLNGAQTIIAVLIYRIAENRRRRPQQSDPIWVRYASCFIAMQMGKYLLRDLGCKGVAGLTHQNFNDAKKLVETRGDEYFSQALDAITAALALLYRDSEISVQRLSATFRRADLIEKLEEIEVSKNENS